MDYRVKEELQELMLPKRENIAHLAQNRENKKASQFLKGLILLVPRAGVEPAWR